MSATAIAAIAVFAAAYILIATERYNRAAVALTGAAAMVIIGATRGHEMFFSELTGIDWNVVLLLFGMMVIVGVLRTTGAFEFLAIWAAAGHRSTAAPDDDPARHRHRRRVSAARQRHDGPPHRSCHIAAL